MRGLVWGGVGGEKYRYPKNNTDSLLSAHACARTPRPLHKRETIAEDVTLNGVGQVSGNTASMALRKESQAERWTEG